MAQVPMESIQGNSYIPGVFIFVTRFSNSNIVPVTDGLIPSSNNITVTYIKINSSHSVKIRKAVPSAITIVFTGSVHSLEGSSCRIMELASSGI